MDVRTCMELFGYNFFLNEKRLFLKKVKSVEEMFGYIVRRLFSIKNKKYISLNYLEIRK